MCAKDKLSVKMEKMRNFKFRHATGPRLWLPTRLGGTSGGSRLGNSKPAACNRALHSVFGHGTGGLADVIVTSGLACRAFGPGLARWPMTCLGPGAVWGGIRRQLDSSTVVPSRPQRPRATKAFPAEDYRNPSLSRKPIPTARVPVTKGYLDHFLLPSPISHTTVDCTFAHTDCTPLACQIIHRPRPRPHRHHRPGKPSYVWTATR